MVNSSDLFSRDGIFLVVVKTLALMDPILKDHLEAGSKNAHVTSWKIQMKKSAALQNQRELKSEIY